MPCFFCLPDPSHWSSLLYPPPHQDHASISPSPGSLTPSSSLGSSVELQVPCNAFLGYTPHALSLHPAPSLSSSFPLAVPDSIWGPLRKKFRPL